MTLSHGQSEVVRGFSRNESALVDNMQMEYIVAQRKVNDYMRKNYFQPHNIPMSKALLQNVKQANFRYKKKRWARSKSKRLRKALGYRNRKRNSWFECYKKEADKYAFEAENKKTRELLKPSNSLKRACKEKQGELDECLKKKQKLMSKSDI